MSDDSPLFWFAIWNVRANFAYALDAYPEEPQRTASPCRTSCSRAAQWLRRTNLWRERTNLRTGSERLRGVGRPLVVAPPPTDAQVIAGTILGIAGMVINASMKETLVLKTVSYLALVTPICVVILWVFMALRPANAQRGYRHGPCTAASPIRARCGGRSEGRL